MEDKQQNITEDSHITTGDAGHIAVHLYRTRQWDVQIGTCRQLNPQTMVGIAIKDKERFYFMYQEKDNAVRLSLADVAALEVWASGN